MRPHRAAAGTTCTGTVLAPLPWDDVSAQNTELTARMAYFDKAVAAEVLKLGVKPKAAELGSLIDSLRQAA